VSAAAASIPGLVWRQSPYSHYCVECGGAIMRGDREAVYNDVFVTGTFPLRHHIKRIYCEECGHLLEDSLTTTEAE
jgi:hypothetical protein